MKFLSATKAASLLGVSPATVIRWVKEGLFPKAMKIGAVVRIPESDIAELIEKSQFPQREGA